MLEFEVITPVDSNLFFIYISCLICKGWARFLEAFLRSIGFVAENQSLLDGFELVVLVTFVRAFNIRIQFGQCNKSDLWITGS